VCTRGSNRALLCGPSTSPLDAHVRWWSILGLLLGPLMGLGAWWAEGSYSGAHDSSDAVVWDNNFWLNRLLIAILFGTFISVLVVPFMFGRRFSLLNTLGAFACGCLAWLIVFIAIARPHFVSRYADLERFARLRYGYNANSPFLIISGSVFALGWITYAVLRV
jgi:hypothetical protein